MNRLSSSLTFVVKFIVPLTGIAGAVLVSYLVTTVFDNPPPTAFTVVFVVLLIAFAFWPHVMASSIYYGDGFSSLGLVLRNVFNTVLIK